MILFFTIHVVTYWPVVKNIFDLAQEEKKKHVCHLHPEQNMSYCFSVKSAQSFFAYVLKARHRFESLKYMV